MRSVIALVAGALCLGVVNFSIAQKERQLRDGTLVFLELVPVDPRSLMQGDYMALGFKMAADARRAMPRPEPTRGPGSPAAALATADGRIVATLDARSVASFERLDDGRPLAANEVLLRYRVREGELKFATNAFFFQEGTAQRYEGARYGEFRVAADGELLLAGLRGKALGPL